MNYRRLTLHCHCGETPDIGEVGFTDDHSLVIHWWCSQCKKLVFAVKSLTECWQDCPNPSDSLEKVLATPSDNQYRELDDAFLRSIGVRV